MKRKLFLFLVVHTLSHQLSIDPSKKKSLEKVLIIIIILKVFASRSINEKYIYILKIVMRVFFLYIDIDQ
jgi:hypothetical protein